MRAERPRGSELGLVLVAALLASGCASLPARPGKVGRGTALAFSPFSAPSQAARSAAAGVYPSEESGSADGPSMSSPMSYRRGPIGNAVRGEGTRGSDEAGGAFACGGKALPSGWLHLDSSREVLAPFLECASPAEFVAMQRGVDMAALVESLEDWDAVRLGALGPMDAKSSAVLGRKRAAFLVTSVEKYGVPYAEVLALFVLHSSFDDELREVLQRLAQDKQLGETLGSMSVVREELKRRGMALEGFPERGEQARDVLRGLGRAGRDMLSSSAASDGARGQSLWAKRTELPLPYQAALDEVQKALTERHYSPGSVSAGAFDSLTFGVPVGFYHLVAGTGHGAYSLAQGKYEQATRELAPAALMVALYAGGKGARALVESNAGGRASLRRLSAPDVKALKAVVKELEAQFGPDAVREVLSFIRGDSRGAFLAAVEGPPGIRALYEARGNPAKAQATWAERYREPSRASAPGGGIGKRSGGSPSLPPEAAGIPAEVAEAKLRQAEAEAGGARLPMDVGFLKKHREALQKAAPPGTEVHALWPDYLSYLERRIAEVGQRKASKGPLEWAGYQVMRDRYARGLAFERTMVALLEEDAALPRAQRRWLKDFDQPRIETHVGVAKADIRFADVLIIEEGPAAGATPRVETFSLKSRDLRTVKVDPLTAQIVADAKSALAYYGETLSIRRPGLEMKVQVRRVRLVYEATLKPENSRTLKAAVDAAQEIVTEVEVLFQ
ncbi:hypothetical protein POL68_25000 [Stigmatella sp. ncwal1]|uniref:Lipoprotein n=1 Tax=Stigmatella ashevillensis TaxID=2995309 RepID=A0ABT5DHB0_9BACT|nr:hypothetical protein [Stigmatella ashevillena]MDC0711751.1 hypothetical protein [Stigmatella ashevillena]